MKKYLLSLLITGFTFFGFSSATVLIDYTFDGSEENLSTFMNNYVYDNVYRTPENEPIYIAGEDFSASDSEIYLKRCPSSDSTFSECGDSDGYFSSSIDSLPITVDFGNYTYYGFVIDDFYGNINGRLLVYYGDLNDSENSDSSSLLPDGTSTLTPVITGLTNSVNEFIPYVVYIGLGVLGVIISFVAIKRLIRRISAKILGSFKK